MKIKLLMYSLIGLDNFVKLNFTHFKEMESQRVTFN